MTDCVVCENCGKHKGYMPHIVIGFGCRIEPFPDTYDVCNKKCGLALINKKIKNWSKWWAV